MYQDTFEEDDLAAEIELVTSDPYRPEDPLDEEYVDDGMFPTTATLHNFNVL